MRPIERKILKNIKDNGTTFDEVWEMIDKTSQTELKKSYPDECHFHNDKYFAKLILDSLQRSKLIYKEGNKFFPMAKKEEKTK